MLKSQVIKILTIGAISYGCLVAGVMTFYPDRPENMNWRDREAFNKVQIPKISLGIQRDEVLALLGSPDITDARIIGDKTLQIMYFRTQHVKADGLTTEDECTPLLFENDRLVAVGEVALDGFRNV